MTGPGFSGQKDLAMPVLFYVVSTVVVGAALLVAYRAVVKCDRSTCSSNHIGLDLTRPLNQGEAGCVREVVQVQTFHKSP
jgi:hypothetical protein